MAFFFTNVCKFNSCGLHFATLYDLIQHIEETHISNDTSDILKKHQEGSTSSTCVPLSCISRFFPRLPDHKAKSIKPEQTVCSLTQARRRSSHTSSSSAHATLNFHPQPTPTVPRAIVRKSAPIDPDYEDESGSLAGDSSYAVSEVDSEEGMTSSDSSFIRNTNSSGIEERKFRCPVSGCNKRYRNLNGMRYHAKIVHRNLLTNEAIYTTASNKPFKCNSCQKSYKTSQGLQNHINTAHSRSPKATATGRQGSVTLIASHQVGKSGQSAPAATVRVSPAPSPFQTAPPPVAGGHQYHQTPPGNTVYHHHQRISNQSSSGGLSFTVPIVTSSVESSRHPANQKRLTSAVTARHYGNMVSRQQSGSNPHMQGVVLQAPVVSASVSKPIAEVVLSGSNTR